MYVGVRVQQCSFSTEVHIYMCTRYVPVQIIFSVENGKFRGHMVEVSSTLASPHFTIISFTYIPVHDIQCVPE